MVLGCGRSADVAVTDVVGGNEVDDAVHDAGQGDKVDGAGDEEVGAVGPWHQQAHPEEVLKVEIFVKL